MRLQHYRWHKARSSYTGTTTTSGRGFFELGRSITDRTGVIDPFTIPDTSSNSIYANYSPRLSSNERQTTEEMKGHPDGTWLQMIGLGHPPASSSNNHGTLQNRSSSEGGDASAAAAAAMLMVPRPMNLAAARHALNMQQQQQEHQHDDEHSYIRTPLTDGRLTASSMRAMTAPPPYVQSPLIRMLPHPEVMDDRGEAPEYRA
jgi:hypothetical protein